MTDPITNNAESQRAVGRPTDYLPEYCERVIEWGKLGKSKAWMCATLDISRPTLDLWIEKHPEFSYAMDVARAHSQLWWEDKGQDNLATAGFQSSMWSRSMAARFPDDWREKNETAITGKNGGAFQVNITSDDDAL